MEFTKTQPVPIFLLKTYSILQSAHEDIVCWSSRGDSFIIKDPHRFGTIIIPEYFKHNKFTSFVRQLNFYGFRKVKGTLDYVGRNEHYAWEFKNRFFLRGRPDLLIEIKREAAQKEEIAKKSRSSGINSEESKDIEELQNRVVALSSQLKELNNSVKEIKKIVAQHELGVKLNPSRGTTPSIQIPVADENLQRNSPLRDFTECPLTPIGLHGPPLKRLKSDESLSYLLNEPIIEISMSPVCEESSATMEADCPEVVQVVSHALATNYGAGSGTPLAFNQYVTAVAAILSCAGMSQVQALAASSAVLSHTSSSGALNGIIPPLPRQVEAI